MATPQPDDSREFRVGVPWERLDKFLAAASTGLSRSQLRRLIVDGSVRVNGLPGKPAQALRPGDRVSFAVPPPLPWGVVPQQVPFRLVYQDSHIAVIDKPAGLSVHPGPGHPDRTLVNGLLAQCPDLQGVGDSLRPGIVHRLDKDTSGLMVVAKTHRAHLDLSGQMKERQVTKGYSGLAAGALSPPAGRIDAPIFRDPRRRQRMAVVPGGRASVTRYRVVESLDGYSLLELYLETGRTHQIRVHLAHLGHPLLGDAVYGKASPLLARQFLHAHHLGFSHPETREPLEFRSGLPPDLAAVLEALGGEASQYVGRGPDGRWDGPDPPCA